MDATIYHNPACGTSRNTLALIRAAGIEPTVIEYLQEPPTRDQLATMIADARLSVREAIREKGDQSLKHVVNFNGEFLAVSREDVHTDKPGSSGGWILGGHLAEPKSSFLDLLNQASGLGGPG